MKETFHLSACHVDVCHVQRRFAHDRFECVGGRVIKVVDMGFDDLHDLCTASRAGHTAMDDLSGRWTKMESVTR